MTFFLGDSTQKIPLSFASNSFSQLFCNSLSFIKPVLKQLTRCGIFPNNILYAYLSSLPNPRLGKNDFKESTALTRYSIDSIELQLLIG